MASPTSPYALQSEVLELRVSLEKLADDLRTQNRMITNSEARLDMFTVDELMNALCDRIDKGEEPSADAAAKLSNALFQVQQRHDREDGLVGDEEDIIDQIGAVEENQEAPPQNNDDTVEQLRQVLAEHDVCVVERTFAIYGLE